MPSRFDVKENETDINQMFLFLLFIDASLQWSPSKSRLIWKMLQLAIAFDHYPINISARILVVVFTDLTAR